MRKRICIISFSPIHRDARVLRQIEYLSPHYDLTVIGYGPPPQPSFPHVEWRPLEVHSTKLTRASGLFWMLAGRVWRGFYDKWYWQKSHHKKALQYAGDAGCDAYLANDWNALPVAAEAARHNKAKLVLDAHEYAPLEYESSRSWRFLYAPLVIYVLRKYAGKIAASMTVAPSIAERYGQVFGFHPVVVLSAPKLVPVEPKEVDFNNIRLVYHGGANRERKLEAMIEVIALADKHFTLDFILVDAGTPYVQELKNLARKLAPERVAFRDPVLPSEIVQHIAKYDIGFFLLDPTIYNYRVALPNKLFDFLAAGLAVCVGPSPGMAALVRQYNCGFVSPTFYSRDMAEMLNALSVEDIEEKRRAASRAALELNADTEMSKVVELFRTLFA